MLATPEEAAKLKKSLVGLLLSAIVIIMAYTIWNLTITLVQDTLYSEEP